MRHGQTLSVLRAGKVSDRLAAVATTVAAVRIPAVAMAAVATTAVAVECLLAAVGAATRAKTARAKGAAYAAGLPDALLADSAPIRAAIPSRTILPLALPRARRPIRTTPPAAHAIFCKPTRLQSDPIECGIRIAEFGISEFWKNCVKGIAHKPVVIRARKHDKTTGFF